MKQTVYHTGFVCTGAALDAIKPQWCALSSRCLDASLHHHWHWHQALNRYLTRNIQYLTVTFGAQLVAVIPLDLSDVSVPKTPACSETPLADMLLDPDHCSPELFQAIVSAITRKAPQWHTLYVRNIPQGSGWAQLASVSQWPMHLDQSGSNAYFDRNKPTGLNPPKKLGKNLTRLSRKLSKEHQEPVLEAARLDDYLSVNRHSWKHLKSHTGLACDDSARAFYTALQKAFASTSQAYLTVLKVDNQPVSAQLGICVSGCLSLLKITYDERFAAFGVGGQHLWKTLQWADDYPLETVNLTTSPSWAERWHPETRPVYELRLYRKSFFGYGAYWLEAVKGWLRPFKQRLLAGNRRGYSIHRTIHPHIRLVWRTFSKPGADS